jgi:DNA-binding NarL/FixJ family response regulator
MYLIDQRVVLVSGDANGEMRKIADTNHWPLLTPGPIESMIDKIALRQVQIVAVEIDKTNDPGLELIRTLRCHWRPPHCLVVALISQTALEQAALTAGASCYISGVDKLESTILSFLNAEIRVRPDESPATVTGRVRSRVPHLGA